jgi:hypothetical protein
MVVDICNPSYVVDTGRRITVLLLARPIQASRQYLKNNLKQKELGVWLK